MENVHQREYVLAAKNGSAAAFGALYESLAPELYRFALWYLHDENDAEDAVQDAMLNAWTHLCDLRKEAAFRSWLFKILANACVTLLRKKNSLQAVSLEADPAAQALSVPAAFENDAVGSLLAELSPEDRAIVAMAVLGDFTSREIGETLGMKSGTVRSRLSRALHTLRTQSEMEGALQ